jgi:hypothetical protein
VTVQAIRRLTKAEAFAAFEADPELASNATAAARRFHVARSTARGWRDQWRTAHSPLSNPAPPLAALSSPPTAMATPELPPAPPWPPAMSTSGLAAVPPVAADAARYVAPGRLLAFAAYASAVALATIAAYFSIRGMVVLFPGAPIAIIVMGVAMEVAKLITVAFLAHEWCRLSLLFRAVLFVLVTGLAAINAAGVFSQLVAAHLGDRATASASIETEASALAARIEVQSHNVADLDARVAQIDAAIAEMTKRGRTNGALDAIGSQRKTRADLVSQRRTEADTLAKLRADQASIAAKVHAVEVEAAPIRFVAELVGGSTDLAIRFLILLMVLTCDPLAIALTVAATARSENMASFPGLANSEDARRRDARFAEISTPLGAA